MKKFLFLLSFLTLGALTTLNAQTETAAKKSCSKSEKKACCAKKTATASATKSCSKAEKAACSKSTSVASKSCTKSEKAACSKGKTTAVAGVIKAAHDAAEADESIEERTCAKSGKVSYYQKAECPMTGKVSYSEVRYCNESGKFVSATSCSKGEKKACSKEAKTAKVVKTSVKE